MTTPTTLEAATMMPDGVDEEHTTTPPPSRLLFQVRSRVLLDVAEQQQPLLWMGEVVDRRSSSSNNNFVTNCEDVRDPKDCLRDPHILFDPLTKIPMEYTCRSDLEERSTLTELEGLEEVEVEDDDDLRVAVAETWVQVDYEALLPIQADAKYNERQLQWRVLLAAVEEVGLDRCDFTKQRGRPLDDDVDDIDTDTDTDTTTSTTSTTPPRLRRGRRQRRRQRHLEEFSTATTAGLPANLTIYAIENDLASSFAFPIPCQYLATTEDIPDVQCLPIRTVLKLKYYLDDSSNNTTATTTRIDDPEGLVQAHVQHLLQTNLEDRTQSLYVGDVMGLYYVGTHNLDVTIEDDIQTGNKDHKIAPDDDPSIIRIGSFVSAASAIVLLLFLFAVRRRRNQEGSENDSSSTKPATSQAMGVVLVQEGDGDDLSMQLPLDMRQAETLEDPCYITSSSSSSSTNVSQDSSEEPSLRHDHTLLYDTSATTRTATLQEDIIVQKEHDLMVDNDIASIFRSSSSDLPPRPPTSSSSSSRVVANLTTTSRRRRRKKKKRRKRPTLQRVNSREGIHTMEAIPEVGSGDDDDDDQDNDDRYYSSTEEEENEASSSSSSRASSSGYNTPVGPDEEDASPRTRQRFPSDPDAADAERILETLHFHLGNTTKTTTNDDDDIQRCTTLKTSNKAVAITNTTTTSSSWELEPSSPQSSSSNNRRSFRSSLSGWF